MLQKAVPMKTTSIKRLRTPDAPDYTLAQSILGEDFITPEEVTRARPGIVYSKKQITTLAQSLPPEGVLKWYKFYGYALMPAPPRASSMLDVREMKPGHFLHVHRTSGWYTNQKFARKDKTSFGWLAIKKTPPLNSTNKTWNEQGKILREVERVPNAAEVSWFITTFFAVRGIRLFKDICARTSSLSSDGVRILIGFFAAAGLLVSFCSDYIHVENIGLAVARN